jgi:hypothetical protein
MHDRFDMAEPNRLSQHRGQSSNSKQVADLGTRSALSQSDQFVSQFIKAMQQPCHNIGCYIVVQHNSSPSTPWHLRWLWLWLMGSDYMAGPSAQPMLCISKPMHCVSCSD